MSRLYQVQSVRDHKEEGGQTQYLIHWKRFSDLHDSWEPKSNLKGCETMIEEYHMKLERKATPKRKTQKDPPVRQSTRLASLRRAATEIIIPQDRNTSTNDLTIVTSASVDSAEKLLSVEKKEEKKTRLMKRRSQSNVTVTKEPVDHQNVADQEHVEKKKVQKRLSKPKVTATDEVEVSVQEHAEQTKVQKHLSQSDVTATGDFNSIKADEIKMLKSYELRHRMQPMPPPVYPIPSASILLSSDEEADILSRHPVRKGRSPHRKIGVAPDPAIGKEKEEQFTIMKSVAKYSVSVQEGNLLVRKVEPRKESKPIEEAAPAEQEVKATEPIISDVEEEEEITTPQAVVSLPTSPPYPMWMHLNFAEFLFALLLTALLFVVMWCWNSDVC